MPGSTIDEGSLLSGRFEPKFTAQIFNRQHYFCAISSVSFLLCAINQGTTVLSSNGCGLQ